MTARDLTRETDPASRDTGAPTSAGCAALQDVEDLADELGIHPGIVVG